MVSPPCRIKDPPALTVVVPVMARELPAVVKEPVLPPPTIKLPAQVKVLVNRLTLAPSAMVTL